MNAEMRGQAEAWAQSFDERTEDGWGGIAALLRAGIAASEECERLLERHYAVLSGHSERMAWLAAWDVEWQAQEYHWADRQAFEESQAQVALLQTMLGRAAMLLDKASALILANGKDCGGNLSTEFAEQYAAEFAVERDALLSEIEVAL